MRYNFEKKGTDLAKKVIIFKPRAVIHSKINRIPSPIEQKFFNLALKKAKEKINYFSTKKKYKDIVEDWKRGVFELVPSISISLTEIKTLFPSLSHRGKKQLYEFFSRMEEIKIEKINILKKDEEKEILRIEEVDPDVEISDRDFEQVDNIDIDRLISNVSIRFRDDVVSFYLPPIIIAYLANPNMYINLNLLVLNYLRKSYSITLYEFLFDYIDNQKRKIKKDYYETDKIPLNKLKEILGISKDKYSRYADFKKWVLEPAIKELNSTDVVNFFTEYQEIKSGRKVEYIKFLLEPKPQYAVSDVILTKDGIKKISYEESINEMINEYPVKKELLELKEKVKAKLPYIIFKRELMKIQESYICNEIEGYLPHLFLRTNKIGHIEIYNPQTDEVRELDKIKDSKELEELRRWLYENPDRIGDIKKIDENDILKYELEKDLLHKYYLVKKDGMYLAIKINNIKIKDNKITLMGDEVIEGLKNVTITFKKENLEKEKSRITDKIENSQIEDYQYMNKVLKEERTLNEFKNKATKELLEELIEKWENEVMRLTDEWKKAEAEKDEERMDKVSQKIAALDSHIMQSTEYLSENKIPSIATIQKILKEIEK